uniref:Uncharacterized protein n=1 Tax=Panagrolaimus superbus TaxID=310955 RepID=A0A914Y6A4_9BILA
MSKNSRKAIKKAPLIIKEDKDCQTEELLSILADVSIADNNVPTTSATCVQDLTKEQLITRLSLSQTLCKRLKALFTKEREFRKEEQQKFVAFFHEIKVLL